ncbi:hypothetical protein B0H14DRAFT_2880759, partial [Mycena olivaceomarginata]
HDLTITIHTAMQDGNNDEDCKRSKDVYDIPILGTVLLWTISYFISQGVGPRQLSQPRIAGCPAGTHHLWEHQGAPHKKHALTRVGDLTVTMAKMNLLFVTAAVAFPFLARRRPH